VLNDKEPRATVAVTDIERAKKFYGGTLGLRPAENMEPEAIVYAAGGSSSLLVYRSQFAGSNKATAVTWHVDDVEGTVGDLKAKGVAFEHYDLPGLTRNGDVHLAGDLKNAWFKDPDGNIHALVGK
jgi:catechol 2,3-dioxygenase-like lactoylglutathione lyase family enzyme